MADVIPVQRVDHVGIRVADADRALAFYEMLGFTVHQRVSFDPVIIIRNEADVEINLVINAAEENDGTNVLMDVPEKHAGITHLAFRVPSIVDAMKVLKKNGVKIT